MSSEEEALVRVEARVFTPTATRVLTGARILGSMAAMSGNGFVDVMFGSLELCVTV